jgi:excisionase family DNA binding protein
MTLTVEREYLTVAEAAVLWRVSIPTVYRKIAAGGVPHIRVGTDGPIRIPACALALPAEGIDPTERRESHQSGQSTSRAHGGDAACATTSANRLIT